MKAAIDADNYAHIVAVHIADTHSVDMHLADILAAELEAAYHTYSDEQILAVVVHTDCGPVAVTVHTSDGAISSLLVFVVHRQSLPLVLLSAQSHAHRSHNHHQKPQHLHPQNSAL